MNELVSVPISPWYTIPAAVGLLALTFVFAPGVLLHLGVLLFPKGHERRKQFTADLYDVPYLRRPFWVASTLVRCLFEGLPARIQLRKRRQFLYEGWAKFFAGAIDTAIEDQEKYLKSLPPWRRMRANIKIWRVRQQAERLRKGPPE